MSKQKQVGEILPSSSVILRNLNQNIIGQLGRKPVSPCIDTLLPSRICSKDPKFLKATVGWRSTSNQDYTQNVGRIRERLMYRLRMEEIITLLVGSTE